VVKADVHRIEPDAAEPDPPEEISQHETTIGTSQLEHWEPE